MSILATIFGGLTGSQSESGGLFGGNWPAHSTTAGETVSVASARSLSVYWACIRNLSEDVGKLPLITYKRRSDRGKDRATSHPLYRVLHDSPNGEMTSMSFRGTLTQHAMAWGNGYAEIERTTAGKPLALHPIHPSRVSIVRDEGGQLWYLVQNDNFAKPTPIVASDMLHIVGLSDDGVIGLSVLSYAAESLGLTIAAQKFGAAFFGNGTHIGGVVEVPKQLSDPSYARLRESWLGVSLGSANAHKPRILEGGSIWKPTGVPPEQAQFLETRRFQVEEICRWFRVPPRKVGDMERAQGWSTLEASNTEYVVDAMMPWLVRWEQELSHKLFSGDAEHFAEHLVAGLLRGDMAARTAFYSGQFQTGAMSPNDIRESENLNPVDGGDQYFVQLNMAPLGRVGEEPPATLPPPTPPPVDDPDAKREGLRAATRGLFAEALHRVDTKAIRATCRAAAKHCDAAQFEAWAQGFFVVSHADYMRDALVAPAETLASLAGDSAHMADVVAAFIAGRCNWQMTEALVAHSNGSIELCCEGWRQANCEPLINQIIEVCHAG